MTTTSECFAESLSVYKREQSAPWGRLLYGIAAANLRRHLTGDALHFLDAGGGNGRDTIPFAAQGHHITLLDFSPEMLTEARRNAEASGVTEQMTFVQSDVAAIPILFPEPTFDVVLCHNVIQYLDDVTITLQAVCHALRHGGLISIMSVNRYSEPYRLAYQKLDLAAAYASLSALEFASLFSTSVHLYTADEMRRLLALVGCSVIGEYGVRCICDYIPDNDIKNDPTFFSQLAQLEYALTDRHPYQLLARFFQVIARKTGA